MPSLTPPLLFNLFLNKGADVEQAGATRCALTTEPRDNLLVLNGSAGALQFYNIHLDHLAFEVAVTERIFVSRAYGKDIAPTLGSYQ